MSLRAGFAFLGVIVAKIVWFGYFQTNFNLQDVQLYFPLSSLILIGHDDVDSWWIYPLQVLNLFELAYWLILAYLLGKELKVTFEKGLKIVASSYGPALLIWVVAVTFFTLNNS